MSVKPSQAGRRLKIDLGPLTETDTDNLAIGDSVAVDGLCLTAALITPPAVEFDIIAESLSRSTLGDLTAGSSVNLERALPAAGRLDGHIVQGHVDGIAAVQNIIARSDQTVIEFTAEASLLDQMVPKGSIAINGVSLTLVKADRVAKKFSVAIIPTTLADTTLPALKISQRVNIETDIIGKYVRRYLHGLLDSDSGNGNTGPASGGLTMDKLKQAGFM